MFRLAIINTVLILCSGITSLACAQNLCDNSKNHIDKQMRIPESEFTRANADQSAAFLKKIKIGDIKNYEWFEPGNARKFITGYNLKAYALNNKNALTDYCHFITNAAFYYD